MVFFGLLGNCFLRRLVCNKISFRLSLITLAEEVCLRHSLLRLATALCCLILSSSFQFLRTLIILTLLIFIDFIDLGDGGLIIVSTFRLRLMRVSLQEAPL